jgi:MFS family permease
MGIMQLINIVLFWLFFGFFASHFAKKRGRHPLGWFCVGLFLGVIGVLLLLLLPKVEKKSRPTPKPLRAFSKRSESWLKMWYFLDPTHAQQGPFEFPDMIKKWKENGIDETSFVWGEGMKEWKRLSDMPDLMKEIEQA